MGIYDGLKDAAKTLQDAGKIEQYKQILEAQEKMLDMQKRISDLENKNTELRDKLKIKAELKFRNIAYWKDGDNEPFCSRCWGGEYKVIYLRPCGNPAYYDCPNCKANSVIVKPELDRFSRARASSRDPYDAI